MVGWLSFFHRGWSHQPAMNWDSIFVHASIAANAGAASYPNASTSAKRSMLVPATRLLMHFFTKSRPAVASASCGFHLKKHLVQSVSSESVFICMSKCLLRLLGVSEGSIHGKFSTRWFVHVLPWAHHHPLDHSTLPGMTLPEDVSCSRSLCLKLASQQCRWLASLLSTECKPVLDSRPRIANEARLKLISRCNVCQVKIQADAITEN